MALDPETTAVILIEFQNDFTSEGGVLHGAVSEVMESTGMLARSAAVADSAREAGATVMHRRSPSLRATTSCRRTRTGSSRGSSTATRS